MESHHDLIPLFEHDLFGKPVSTFSDHALYAATVEILSDAADYWMPRFRGA
jgi:hypothetical protein